MSFIEVIAFLIVVIIQTGSPGPSTLLVVNNSINYGYKLAIIFLTGDLIATSLIGIVASLGLVIIIEDYPIFLPTIKIIGGVYLFYIVVKTWLSHNGPIESVNNTKLLFSRIWVRSFVISISNPKAIIFFTVFFPIFISSEDNASYELYILLISFIAIKFVILSGYAVLFHVFFNKLSEASVTYINKISAVIFCIFGTMVIISVLLY